MAPPQEQSRTNSHRIELVHALVGQQTLDLVVDIALSELVGVLAHVREDVHVHISKADEQTMQRQISQGDATIAWSVNDLGDGRPDTRWHHLRVACIPLQLAQQTG